MATLRTGFLRYALLRLAGAGATIIVTIGVLALLPGSSGGLDANGLALAGQRLGVTLPLTFIALLIGTLAGVVLGYVAATSHIPGVAAPLSALGRVLVIFPPFWIGMVLILIVTGVFGLSPPGGFVPWGQDAGGAFSSLMLPALALALPLAATLMRRVQLELADRIVSAEHFSRRGNGLGADQATLAQALALLPSLAARVGRLLGPLLAGAMIIENVFYLPGLGRLLFEAVTMRNMPVVAAAILLLVIFSALGRLAGGLGRAALYPRPPARAA